MKTKEAQITYVDQQNGGFSDAELAERLGMSFNVNSLRPYWYKGKVYVNHQVGFDANKQPVFKAKPITANAVLMRDEWIEIDRTVKMIARERLVGASDILSRGLVYNLNNPMGKTVLEYQDMNDPGEAQVNMDGANQGKNDRPVYKTKYLPIPIIHSDFTLSQRNLEASRNSGDSIDTTMIEACTRRVVEKLEDMLFTNTTFSYGSGTIQSYINFTYKNSVTLTTNWNASGKTGAQIKDDVLNLVQASINAKHYGPWVMYIPTAYQTVMGEDYTTGYPKTIKQRLMEIDGISDIKVADRLAANTVLLVEMNSGTVRMINGFAPRVVQWSTQGGMIHHFKVMAIQVPQLRADQNGNSGVNVLAA